MVANLGQLLPKDVGCRFSFAGLFMDMKPNLIELEEEPESTEENIRPRLVRLAFEPVNDAEISPQQRCLVRQFMECGRSHEYSPLND
jgi:hypothetical protein